jgi:hypothetical protein
VRGGVSGKRRGQPLRKGLKLPRRETHPAQTRNTTNGIPPPDIPAEPQSVATAKVLARFEPSATVQRRRACAHPLWQLALRSERRLDPQRDRVGCRVHLPAEDAASGGRVHVKQLSGRMHMSALAR